jgi:hypothetical protein
MRGLSRRAWGKRSRQIGHSFLDIRPFFSYGLGILLSEGRGLETHLDTERVRFLRAGFVTPLPGGLGIVPSGITIGVRGAPLKRE